MIDESGNIQASYSYDPYGKVLSATGPLAEKNPLRYRGYYYDTESGLYYLISRYYDPNTCSFINADSQILPSIGGLNLYSYCLNNPVNYVDIQGYWPQWIDSLVCWIVGIVVTVVVQVINQVVDTVQPFSSGEGHSLPFNGDLGASQTLRNPDGTPKQKRWYGPDGTPERDRDYSYLGKAPFPHDHVWENGRRGAHLPPSPDYEFNLDPMIGLGLVFVCGTGMVMVAIDDSTGIGVLDNFLYIPLYEGITKGLMMVFW